MFAAEFLIRDFPERLQARYKLDPLPGQPDKLLEAIARSKGYVKGAHVDWHRISELLLNEFRAGKLGRMSLELPPAPEPEPEPEPAAESSAEPAAESSDASSYPSEASAQESPPEPQ